MRLLAVQGDAAIVININSRIVIAEACRPIILALRASLRSEHRAPGLAESNTSNVLCIEGIKHHIPSKM